MDYATLSLVDVRSALADVARETQATFGGLNARQLNWRPDASRWSVAQCFEHVLTANNLMFQAAEDALNGAAPPRTLWQRLPLLPATSAARWFARRRRARPGASLPHPRHNRLPATSLQTSFGVWSINTIA